MPAAASEVVFYLLPAEAPVDVLRFGCRLALRALQEKRHMQFYVSGREQAAQLDDLLWTFKDISFVPHRLQDAQPSSMEPPEACVALIAWPQCPPREPADIIVDLRDREEPLLLDCQRIIDPVTSDVPARQRARQRYRAYRERNCTLQTHDLGQGPEASPS